MNNGYSPDWNSGCVRLNYVRFEGFTAVTMKNAVFWDVTPCRFCMNWRFGGTYRLQLQDRKIRERGTSLAAATCSRLFLARVFFYLKGRGDTFLRNFGSHKICTAPHPRRRHSSCSSQVWIGHLLSWTRIFVVFLSHTKQFPYTLIRSLQIPSKFLPLSQFIYHKSLYSLANKIVIEQTIATKQHAYPFLLRYTVASLATMATYDYSKEALKK
jgi:hypothetical protein